MTKKLIAYKDSNIVGTLTRSGEESYVFRYEPSWLENKTPQPLSLTLPLQTEAFSAEVSRTFFANLLPEGQLRDHYASRHRISPEDDFELLVALAGDCAGAISLYPEGNPPPSDQAQQRYRILSEDDVKKLFHEAFIMDLTFLGEGEMTRLSLAGVQDKLPINFLGQEIRIPLDGAPSTHILKPQNPRFKSLAENEAFCMTLAQKMGLNVPTISLLSVGGETSYVIDRYDREIDEDGRITRIQQEDFCQATGTSYRSKYEERGGPGYKACFGVIKECKNPLADRIKLINLVVFNYLICNADCHAKNISLLYYGSKRPNLAPFYDLACTAVYPNISRTLAMSIGGEFDPRNITKKSWEEFSRQIGEGSPSPTLKTLQKMVQEIPAKAKAVAKELTERYGANPIYTEIVRVVIDRANAALRQVVLTN